MRAQTLAATNRHLCPAVESVLAEVMTGVTRLRQMDGQGWVVNFTLHPRGLVAEIRAEENGAHAGAWRVKVKAL